MGNGRRVARGATAGGAGGLATVALAGAIMAAAPAAAADMIPVTPVSVEECADLAKAVGRVVDVQLASEIGSAEGHAFSNISGTACILSGQTAGLSQSFEALAKIGDHIDSWTRDPSYDADAPGSTSATFRRGRGWLNLTVEVAPPPGTCDSVMISDCDVPAEQWTWTVDGMAFDTPTDAAKLDF